MKNQIRRKVYLAGLAACAATLLAGCATDRENVLAVTGTVIGVQIHEKDTDKTPELKVGYARAEFAYVPTDKGSNGSAAHSAEVLMEINAQGNLGLGTAYQGAIYQRLAVGKTAVSRPGAAFMMSKDNSGKLDKGTADALAKATATVTDLPTADVNITAEKNKMFAAFNAANATDKDKFEDVAKTAGYPTTGGYDHPAFRNFVSEIPTTQANFKTVRDGLTAKGLTW
jgi:hypothetical protein